MFTWSQVESLVLVPAGDSPPYLMVVTTFRLPEEKEWLLKADSLRARAQWAVDMVAAILRAREEAADRAAKREATGSGSLGGSWCSCVVRSPCCGSKSATGAAPEAFLMDAARVACETARRQPSPEGMERLEEVLYLLAKHKQHNHFDDNDEPRDRVLVPHIPSTALQRFGDVVRRARIDFAEWQQWRHLRLLLSSPPGLDTSLWKEHVLPFLWPRDPTLRDETSNSYPDAVDTTLVIAAERCQRTLS
jgi:hypothetical protein